MATLDPDKDKIIEVPSATGSTLWVAIDSSEEEAQAAAKELGGQVIPFSKYSYGSVSHGGGGGTRGGTTPSPPPAPAPKDDTTFKPGQIKEVVAEGPRETITETYDQGKIVQRTTRTLISAPSASPTEIYPEGKITREPVVLREEAIYFKKGGGTVTKTREVGEERISLQGSRSFIAEQIGAMQGPKAKEAYLKQHALARVEESKTGYPAAGAVLLAAEQAKKEGITIERVPVDRGFFYGAKSAISREVGGLVEKPTMESPIVQAAAAGGVFAMGSVFLDVMTLAPHPAIQVVGYGGKLLLGSMVVGGLVETSQKLTSPRFKELTAEEKGEIIGLASLEAATFATTAAVTYKTGKGALTPLTERRESAVVDLGQKRADMDIKLSPTGEVQYFPTEPLEPGVIYQPAPIVKAIDTGGGGGGVSLGGDFPHPMPSFTKRKGGGLELQEIYLTKPAGTETINLGTVKTDVSVMWHTTRVTDPLAGAKLLPSLYAGSLKSPPTERPQPPILMSEARAPTVKTALKSEQMQRVGITQGIRFLPPAPLKVERTIESIGQTQKVSVTAGQIQTATQQQRAMQPLRMAGFKGPPVGGFKFDWGIGSKAMKGKPKGKVRSVKTRYKPSFAALALGKRGKEPKIMTGIEMRPIVKSRKKKKKRGDTIDFNFDFSF